MSTHPAAARLIPEVPVATRAPHEPNLVAVPTPEPQPAGPFVPMSIGAWTPGLTTSRDALKRRILAISDVAAVGAVLVALLSTLGMWSDALTAVLSVPVVLLVFHFAGLYARDELRLGHTTLDEAPLLLAITGLLTLGATMILPRGVHAGFGGGQIAALWSATFIAVLCARVLARAVARRVVPVERCLVIGDMKHAERLRDKIATSVVRAEVVGCVSMSGEDIAEMGHPQAIRSIAEEVGAHRLIIAGTSTGAATGELIRSAKAVGLHLTLLPQMLDVVGSAASFHDLEGLTLLGVSRFGLPRSSRLLKRALDLVGAVAGLILISPVLTGIALAIRLDSKGPIFFRQIRVGRDGRRFSIVKFRSMVADADRRKDALRAVSGSHQRGLFKLHDDPRITRVGNVLRKSSLDELPQLFNVLRGEMSLVGPRPLVVDEDCQIVGLHRQRLHLTPGMTGPWQLLRSRVPLQEMVEIDYQYVAGWSLWQDVKILLRTAGHVARRANV